MPIPICRADYEGHFWEDGSYNETQLCFKKLQKSFLSIEKASRSCIIGIKNRIVLFDNKES